MGLFHVNGVGSKSSEGPSKPRKPNFLAGCPGLVCRDIPGLPENREKCVQLLFPIYLTQKKLCLQEKSIFFNKKMHVSAGKCIIFSVGGKCIVLHERPQFFAVCSGGLRIMNGSLFLVKTFIPATEPLEPTRDFFRRGL